VGCIFCVTGKLGFKKNLPWQEIILQILYANNYIKQKFGKKEDGTWNRVRNVVFM
jgi:adenine C2-methylase RlmN of 23S rRNA A2503 and tRNA A37